jgi:hypothetical protein
MIATPDEVAARNRARFQQEREARRIEDEAADEALLRDYLPAAVAMIEGRYCGGEIVIPLPGVELPFGFDGAVVEGRTTARIPDRFAARLDEALAPFGWHVKLWGGRLRLPGNMPDGPQLLAVDSRAAVEREREMREARRDEEDAAAGRMDGAGDPPKPTPIDDEGWPVARASEASRSGFIERWLDKFRGPIAT